MRELINLCFEGDKKNPQKNPQVIAVTKFGATSTNNKNKLNITFDKASLKLANNFLLDNYFFNFGNSAFDKSLVFSWVLTQNLLWKIFILL